MSTYPRDYIEWCFGSASTISERTKNVHLAIMEQGKEIHGAMMADFYASQHRIQARKMEYWAEERASIPRSQVLTDRITQLLEGKT